MENSENKNPPVENQLPSTLILRWRELIEIVSKTILTIISIAYIIGLLILNKYIMGYGVYYLNFLRIEYIMIGLVWGFLVAVIPSFAFYVIKEIKLNLKLNDKRLNNWIYQYWRFR